MFPTFNSLPHLKALANKSTPEADFLKSESVRNTFHENNGDDCSREEKI